MDRHLEQQAKQNIILKIQGHDFSKKKWKPNRNKEKQMWTEKMEELKEEIEKEQAEQ